ncbi:2-polyprenyl-6-methoxyphenol hydroxylase [Nannocystis exedens]|uniref:2-polyprenyl-6-methoxyphenol hydroxylase n=1 Tax=Nannocystis exedens TaxID=54 RepID=A0A1I2BYE3_9BACT|nr:FAD-dependent monooxygenase [Nannocystis exedens]PCC71178.1 FAD-dependent oxidoreductase [Nannocystis exedens]SFE61196.1 2-polyprenyl-6-methoxyphenol hydroxylase [Nannocystis exedens]
MTDMTTSGDGRRVLVVGLGISGLATAVRLHRSGWRPLIIERAPARRKGGYFIGLFPPGMSSARRLGVLDAMGDRTARDGITYEVDRLGRRRPSMSFTDIPGQPRVLMRGDIENGLFTSLPDDVEVRFSTVPTAIAQDDRGTSVTLTNTRSGQTTTERFDLVVGADGLRSTVRQLVFGAHEQFLHSLGYMIGACIMSRPVPDLDLHDGMILAEAGRSAWVFPFADSNPGLLFSYRVDAVGPEFARPPIESLRKAYGPEPTGPLLTHFLKEFEAAEEPLFDAVQQVRMPRWHQGRVVLVGDSAWCLTLYSGMGASTGLAGSELLGDMLDRYPGDPAGALAAWERELRPFITDLQARGVKMRQFFTPGSEIERFLRSATLRLLESRFTRPIFHRLLGDRQNSIDIVARVSSNIEATPAASPGSSLPRRSNDLRPPDLVRRPG